MPAPRSKHEDADEEKPDRRRVREHEHDDERFGRPVRDEAKRDPVQHRDHGRNGDDLVAQLQSQVLGVLPAEVLNAGDGRSAAGGGVRPSAVVVAHER